jgi:hypothetical protein
MRVPRSAFLPGLAAAAALLLVAVPAPGQPLQPPAPGEVRRPAPDAGLALVPRDVAAFVSVRVSDLLDHPDLKPAWEQFKTGPAFEAVLALGVAPQELHRVTAFWPSVGLSRGFDHPVLVVTTRQPYNEARVLKTLAARPAADGFGAPAGGPARYKPLAPPPFHESAPRITEPPVIKGPGPGAGAAPPGLGASAPGLPGVGGPPVPPKRTPPKKDDSPDACDGQPPGVGQPPGIGPPPVADDGAGSDFFVIDRGPLRTLLLLDDRTLVFLPDARDGGFTQTTLVAQLLRRKPTGPLADALARAGQSTFAAGIHLTPITAELKNLQATGLAPYAALGAARTAVLTADLGKTAKLTLRMGFADEAAARRAAPVLEEGIRTVAGHLAEARDRVKDGRRPEEVFAVPLLDAAAAGLGKVAVRSAGTVAEATAEIDFGPAAAKALADLLAAIQAQKREDELTNNLKQIGLALHNYHDTTGKFPADVYKDGKPILSWRVQILPYLEEDALYRQLKMDEPWDSPHNKPLLEKTPKVFEVPGRDAGKGKTFYQGFVAPNAGILGGRPWLVAGDAQGLQIAMIADGTSNTLAVVEAADAVPWAQPGDLAFDPKQPLPKLGGHAPGKFVALLFDGSTRVLDTKKFDEKALRALITVNGGEIVNLHDR